MGWRLADRLAAAMGWRLAAPLAAAMGSLLAAPRAAAMGSLLAALSEDAVVDGGDSATAPKVDDDSVDGDSTAVERISL